MGSDKLFAPTWDHPSGYYVFVTATLPSTYMLANVAYEQQWRRVQTQLAQYCLYQNNWDGLGSLAAPSSIFEVAAKLLEKSKAEAGVAPSTATLSPNGAIQIEWWSGQNVLQAEIGDANRIDWVEFGPNKPPKHWSEAIDQRNSARGITWEVTNAVEGRPAASASAT